MNFLSIFVLIPLLMLAGLWAARGIKAIRGVMVTGASALLIAHKLFNTFSKYILFCYKQSKSIVV